MSESDNHHSRSGDECTTTGSFSEHGIEDGTDLITSTYFRLQNATRDQFDPSETFFDKLESAFIWAYLGSGEETGVPEHVELAIDDARALTHEEYADQPGADLRTEVIPTFYRHVADFHCLYRA